MNKVKGLIAVTGLATVVMLAVACGNGEASTTPASDSDPTDSTASTASEPSDQEQLPRVPAGAPEPAGSEPREEPGVPSTSASTGVPTLPAPGVVSTQPVPAPVPPPVTAMEVASAGGGYSTAPLLQVGSSQAGIWVSGEGTISLTPDLALLNIGVETMAETVAEARDEAARAMDAIVTAVKTHGLEDKDVQTRSFNIWPRYEYPEVLEGGLRVRKQTLVGYTVSNSAAIKIRDLDDVGTIIDDVATAGGNATRINGIQFTVEDPKPFMTGLREAAVQDALAKAGQFATLTGVQVGPLVYITENRGGAPAVRDFADAGFAMEAMAAAPPTTVSGGELELSLSVQAAFEIR